MSEPVRFDEAKERLEEIVAEVRRKDTSQEHAIDLLEEGVRLANLATERIDETDMRSGEDVADEGNDSATQAPGEGEDEAPVLE